ncbi:hypothetical protein ES705_08385 [subsurface metagenome]
MLLDRFIDQTSDAELKAALESAELIICDNVSQYFYEDSTKEVWNLRRDFPNVAPPFSTMFLEWMPDWLRQSRHTRRLGLLVFSAQVIGDERVAWSLDGSERVREVVRNILRAPEGERVKWVSMGALFIETHDKGIIPWSEIIWGVSKSGRPVIPEEGLPIIPHLDDAVYFASSDEEIKNVVHFSWMVLHVPFLALSFMHCKNVILREGTYSPNLQKAREQRGKRPFITYRVIEVHPIRKILESEGEAHKTGFKKALHICRGHFKDYMEGPGLFGKIHDIFWWDAHIRGDKKCGMALKDYEVESE